MAYTHQISFLRHGAGKLNYSILSASTDLLAHITFTKWVWIYSVITLITFMGLIIMIWPLLQKLNVQLVVYQNYECQVFMWRGGSDDTSIVLNRLWTLSVLLSLFVIYALTCSACRLMNIYNVPIRWLDVLVTTINMKLIIKNCPVTVCDGNKLAVEINPGYSMLVITASAFCMISSNFYQADYRDSKYVPSSDEIATKFCNWYQLSYGTGFSWISSSNRLDQCPLEWTKMSITLFDGNSTDLAILFARLTVSTIVCVISKPGESCVTDTNNCQTQVEQSLPLLYKYITPDQHHLTKIMCVDTYVCMSVPVYNYPIDVVRSWYTDLILDRHNLVTVIYTDCNAVLLTMITMGILGLPYNNQRPVHMSRNSINLYTLLSLIILSDGNPTVLITDCISSVAYYFSLT